jgi:hypothetical protein
MLQHNVPRNHVEKVFDGEDLQITSALLVSNFTR